MTQPPAVPPAAPLATLRLHLQGSTLTRMIPPSVQVNGAWMPAQFGVNDIPVYAGPVHVHCQAQWLVTYGRADLAFEAAPGSLTEVYYVAPVHQFTTGSIGYQKQRSKGWGVLLGVLGVVLVFVIGAMVLAGIASA